MTSLVLPKHFLGDEVKLNEKIKFENVSYDMTHITIYFPKKWSKYN